MTDAGQDPAAARQPLLDALGIRILSCISGDGKYNEIVNKYLKA